MLAAPSAIPGTSNIEFGVISADRWIVAAHTFRPPPFHRNVSSEFIGLVHGKYIGKARGFGRAARACTTACRVMAPTRESYELGLRVGDQPQYLATP